MREQDLLGRFGGEEFVAMLVAADAAATETIAARLRQQVAALSVPVAGGLAVSVTVSIGVVAVTRSRTLRSPTCWQPRTCACTGPRQPVATRWSLASRPGPRSWSTNDRLRSGTGARHRHYLRGVHESQERGEGGCEIALRRATEVDIERILDVQQPGAIKGLGNIFPQDQHPFPRATLADRWMMEIADAEIAVYVATSAGGPVLGFAARRHDELLHFGTAVETWGAGLARWLHDELLRTYPPGVTRVRLRVFADNLRA